MSEKQIFALLAQFWRDMQQPEFYWEVLALALILAFSWSLSLRLRRRESLSATPGGSALHAFGVGSLKRMFFPLFALVLVLILRHGLKSAHVAHLSLFDLTVPLLVSWALVRVLVYVLRCVFSNGGFLTSFERLITAAIWGGVVLNITGLDDPLIEMLELVSFSIGKQTLNLWLLARLAKATLSVIALLCSLSLVGIDVTALSVFSGALAVGLGLGLQKIASNYVSGFIILLDRSIRLGNLVAIDDKTSGTVAQITTRYTVLRTLTGVEVIIPNEYLVNNIVRNLSFTDTRLRVTVAVQVAYGCDLEQAMALMIAAAQSQPRVLVDPAPGALITGFADSGIDLELGFWVADPEAGTGNVRSDVSLAIWKTFRASGIEIPFPQREVRLLHDAAV